MGTICSTLSGIIAIKHPTLGVLVREDGAIFNRTGKHPIYSETLRAIKGIEEMVNRGIKPHEPNAAYRAQCLFRSLAQPYIDTLLDYMSSRPKSAFQIPVFQYDGKLYPITTVPD